MDPLSFPALTGAALSQAFGFLFGRLAHLLDRREEQTSEIEIESAEIPAAIEGRLEPLTANGALVGQHLEELEALCGALSVYDRRPDRIRTEDTRLREQLGRLRALLEQIYGQRISFRGEDRQPSGVKVIQRMDVSSGDILGINGRRVRHANVSQEVKNVDQGSTVTGIQADDIG
jgi:hypothetical protein